MGDANWRRWCRAKEVTREGAEEEMSTLEEDEEEEEEVRVGLGGMLRIAKEERARISSSAPPRGEQGEEG